MKFILFSFFTVAFLMSSVHAMEPADNQGRKTQDTSYDNKSFARARIPTPEPK